MPVKPLILPDGMRIDCRWNGTANFFIEEPPREFLFKFGGRRYLLPLPWMYYKINATKTPPSLRYPDGLRQNSVIQQVFCSPRQVHRDDDQLYRLPFPNIYDHQRPCYSGFFSNSGTTVVNLIAGTLEAFYDSNFNYDAASACVELGVVKHVMQKEGITRAAKFTTARYEILPLFYALWEKMSFEDVFALPWDRVSSVRTCTGARKENILREPRRPHVPPVRRALPARTSNTRAPAGRRRVSRAT